jgi:aspartate aminotransferase
VLVANGAKPFLLFTVLATSGPGDEVVYPDPGFPIYESAVRFAGATPVPLPLREDRGFSFDPAELESLLTERTRLVILNAPQNPTGGVIPAADLERAAAAILRTPAWVLTDEVYSRITYDVEAPSIASLPEMLDRTILLDGFSKTFSMTGWRLGYAAVPADLVDPLTRLIVNSTSCVPPFVQLAGVAALEGSQDAVVAMVAEFRRRRDYLVPALNSIPGISCIEPGGAFYAFPNVSQLPLDADTLAERLLVEAGVALLAGSAFGVHAADHLRVSYASSLEKLEQAVERIRAFVGALDA